MRFCNFNENQDYMRLYIQQICGFKFDFNKKQVLTKGKIQSVAHREMKNSFPIIQKYVMFEMRNYSTGSVKRSR